MMDKYYKKLSSFLMHNHYINADDGELYEYAAKVVFQGAINIAVTILIGAAFGKLKECLCFISTFIVLRKFTGGLHAEIYSHCLISSTILIIISLIVVRVLEKNNFQIAYMCLAIIAAIAICVLAPVGNNNKPLSKKEKKVYKAVSIILSLALLALTYFLSLNNLVLSYSVGNGIIIVSFLIVLAYFKEKVFLVGKHYDI